VIDNRFESRHFRGSAVNRGLHALFLLTDKPEVYGLPNAENAVLPSRNNVRSYLGSLATAVLGLVGAIIAFRDRGGSDRAGRE
jgi:formate dehydrogenase iron-sulfur subunit